MSETKLCAVMMTTCLYENNQISGDDDNNYRLKMLTYNNMTGLRVNVPQNPPPHNGTKEFRFE